MFGLIDYEQRAKDRVEAALKNAARLAGDAEADRIMLEFYRHQAETTDPHADWWGYANARHKQQEYQTDYDLATRKAREAVARVNAATAKLEKLK